MIKRLAQSINRNCSNHPKLSEVACAASLAHHGYLGPVKGLSLWNVYLSSVPVDQLASLVSCVTGGVYIAYVGGCDLSPILDSLQCKTLEIDSQSLNTEETQALVRAMESRVEELELDDGLALEIRDMMEYSGQGKCWEVWCDRDAADRYKEQLRSWATSRNWRVIRDVGSFEIART